MKKSSRDTWDVFLSHATEDKAEIAKPLTKALMEAGLRVWFDEDILKIGNSISESINYGLAHSTYGIVILSEYYLEKDWTKKELAGLLAKEQSQKIILPVWHKISLERIMRYSPILADRLALNSNLGISTLTQKILDLIDPNPHPSVPRRRSTEQFQEEAGKKKKLNNTVLAIDFGTTKSSSAIFREGSAAIIPYEGNNLFVYSELVMDEFGDIKIRDWSSESQDVYDVGKSVNSIKRFLGRKYDEPQIQQLIKNLPFRIAKAPDNRVSMLVGNKMCLPEELSALILSRLRKNAESYTREKISHAVISIPVNFNDYQRRAMRDAAMIAGFESVRLLTATSAAAMSYGRKIKRNEIIAVYSLGGGTFDFSIIDVGEGFFQVRSVSGDSFLGGDDFDLCIMDYIIKEFERQYKVNLYSDRHAISYLKQAAEKAKIELSTSQETDILIPLSITRAATSEALLMTLTRSKLEELTASLVERTIAPIKQALSDGGLSAGDVNEIILVGGMTKMPAIRGKVRAFFGKESNVSVNPNDANLIGASIQAGVVEGQVKDMLVLDATPFTYSLETFGGVATPVIERCTSIPCRRSQIMSTTSDGQTRVEFHILQGERPMAADNLSLGKFMIDGIHPAARGVAQVEIIFDIDVHGILRVTALDQATGKKKEYQVLNAELSMEKIQDSRERLGI